MKKLFLKQLKLNMDLYKRHVLDIPNPESQYLGMDFPLRPNIAEIAQGMGIYGRRIEDPAELGFAVKEALELGKPALLDVVIDGTV